MTNISSNDNKLDFASVQAIITSENVKVHASEAHGVLTGLVCAGFTFEDQSYVALLDDMLDFTTQNNEDFPKAVKAVIKQMFSELWTDILDDAYTFQLMVPDDDDSLVERGNALGHWVQGFNLGFGIQQKDNAVSSSEVKEVITDFAEIANLSNELEEDEDTEQAFFEISEYVRISALLCFSELGTLPTGTSATPNIDSNNTIH